MNYCVLAPALAIINTRRAHRHPLHLTTMTTWAHYELLRGRDCSIHVSISGSKSAGKMPKAVAIMKPVSARICWMNGKSCVYGAALGHDSAVPPLSPWPRLTTPTSHLKKSMPEELNGTIYGLQDDKNKYLYAGLRGL